MPDQLNTDINIIGGLSDLRPLFRVLGASALTDTTSLERYFVEENVLNIKTLSARRRFLRAVVNNLLTFQNDEHSGLVKGILASEGLEDTKTWLIFWQLILNNDLFRLITRDVYLKARMDGRSHVRRELIDGYISHVFEQHGLLGQWSTETIVNVGRKYLSFLSKIGMLDHSNPKRIRAAVPNDMAMLVLIYLMDSIKSKDKNILANPLKEFAFLSDEDWISRTKSDSYAKFFQYTYNGTELRLIPKLNPEALAHELSERT